MIDNIGNSLVVIENGKIDTYSLDDRLIWEVGRPSKDNNPNIKLHSTTVSRHHGFFQNMDGFWYYVDRIGKNGTVYNGKHIELECRGKSKPIVLCDGDIFVFGGGEEAIINNKTIWAMFVERSIADWRIEDTKGISKFFVYNDDNTTILDSPDKGTVVKYDGGIAIYMGDITYLTGDIHIKEN